MTLPRFKSFYEKSIKIWPFAFWAILILIILLPFNITLKLGFDESLVNPYVRGVLVNYLVPTISINDLSVLLLLTILILETGLGKVSIMSRGIILLLLLYLIVHNLHFLQITTLFVSTRIFLYISAGVLFIEWLKQLRLKESLGYIRFKKILIGTVFLTILFQGILGIVQFERGSTLGLQFLGESRVTAQLPGSSYVDLNGDVFLRAYGTFPHPNILGGFFAVSSVFILLLVRSNQLEKRFGLIAMLGVQFFSLFTFSRITILLILINMILLILPKMDNRKDGMQSIKKESLVFPPVIERFVSGFDGNELSYVERLSLIFVGWELVLNNPFWGVGIGLFIPAMADNAPITGPGIPLLQPVHNIFLLILAENGFLFGSMIIFGMAIYLARGFMISKDKIIALSVILFIIGVGMFDHYLLTLPQGLFMLILSIVLLKELSLSSSAQIMKN